MKKKTIEDIENILNDSKSGTILLSNEYKDKNTKLKFKCGKCNNEFFSNWGNMRVSKHKLCKKCSIIEGGINGRINITTVKNKYLENGFTLIDENYLNNNSSLLCMDSLGYLGYISYNHLDRIKTSKRSGFRRFSTAYNFENLLFNLNNYIKINNIELEITSISENLNGRNTRIYLKCHCGEEFSTTISSFMGGKTACEVCSKSISTYEKRTIEFLKKHNINFDRQKDYPNCKNKIVLRFDFYLKDFDILLEIDGEGHYYPCCFNNCSKEKAIVGYKKTIKNDKIKTEYCNKNNIKLIRIPYWSFDNEEYKTILSNIINN